MPTLADLLIAIIALTFAVLFHDLLCEEIFGDTLRHSSKEADRADAG